MKKSRTFSLEEDVLEKIEEYQKAKKLSSLSSALERIILIELPKRTDLEEIKDILKNARFQNVEKEDYKKEDFIENDTISNSINDSFSSMPD
ncbi:hypothetical protein [Clostridium tarantellae]|uniref:Uncharacterized protein n=1 Tax=Clostridium tarantellae TaxID=39493 RepID=A0A6I1MKX0_9CLOT|nr:hypothetical protein [Clostridium tarantellae]MPQ42852.1 hypothetical protein [Clostridium tarantellae]